MWGNVEEAFDKFSKSENRIFIALPTFVYCGKDFHEDTISRPTFYKRCATHNPFGGGNSNVYKLILCIL